VSARRILLPGLTLPTDDYTALGALLPGHTVILDTLTTPVTGTPADLRRGLTVPEAPYELVGHSVGALAALEWAAQYPGEVSRVVLLDPADPFGTPVPARLGGVLGRLLVAVVIALARSRVLARVLGRWGRRTVLGAYGVVVDPLSPARIDELFGTRAGLAAVARQVVGVPSQVNRVRALLGAGLTVPRVVVMGSSDGALADGLAIARLAARLGVPVVPVPGGHLFPMTHPSTTAAAITEP
jgi:pimeloyl-ACP methyl ester carboxylesterase